MSKKRLSILLSAHELVKETDLKLQYHVINAVMFMCKMQWEDQGEKDYFA